MFYLAAAFLILAQLLGVYGLVSRKADLIFSLAMIALVVLAAAFGAVGAYHQIE